MGILQIVTYAVVKAQRRTKVSFGRTMMHASKLLRLAKKVHFGTK